MQMPSWKLTPNQARAVLRLGPMAGPRELRRAYVRAVKDCHPDRPDGDAARFRLVVEACQVLKAAGPGPQSSAEGAARQHLRRFSAAWAA